MFRGNSIVTCNHLKNKRGLHSCRLQTHYNNIIAMMLFYIILLFSLELFMPIMVGIDAHRNNLSFS